MDNKKWEERVVCLFEWECLIEDYLEKGKITQNESKELRRCLFPLSYDVILNSPDIKDNPTRRKFAFMEIQNHIWAQQGLSGLRVINIDEE